MEDVMGSDRSTTPKTAAKTDSNDIIMDAWEELVNFWAMVCMLKQIKVENMPR